MGWEMSDCYRKREQRRQWQRLLHRAAIGSEMKRNASIVVVAAAAAAVLFPLPNLITVHWRWKKRGDSKAKQSKANTSLLISIPLTEMAERARYQRTPRKTDHRQLANINDNSKQQQVKGKRLAIYKKNYELD